MTHFKTQKAELLFVVLPKDAINVKIYNRRLWYNKTFLTIFDFTDYTLIGKLSEVSEEVAKGLVEEVTYERYKNYTLFFTIWFHNAKASLNSIATNLGMELTDNIYLLKKL